MSDKRTCEECGFYYTPFPAPHSGTCRVTMRTMDRSSPECRLARAWRVLREAYKRERRIW